MSIILIKSLIQQLLTCNTKTKEELGTTLVKLLGGDATKTVTNLPPRKGNADGGLDGRIKVIAPIRKKEILKKGTQFKRGREGEQDAGISVKIQKHKFNREQLGGFKLDLERENIYLGIIITATGLSGETKSVVENLNQEGICMFYHIYIADILMRKIDVSDIKFLCGDISQKLREEVAKSISELTEIEE